MFVNAITIEPFEIFLREQQTFINKLPTALCSEWYRGANGPKLKILLPRGIVTRPVEYICQVSARRRPGHSASGLGPLGF